MRCGQVAFDELDQIVREAEEVRLHLLGDGGVAPSALGPEFVFEFVERFFQIRAAQVEKRDQAGRQRKLAGQELMLHAGGGVRVTDPPQGRFSRWSQPVRRR